MFSPSSHSPGRSEGLETQLIVNHAYDQASVKISELRVSDVFQVAEHVEGGSAEPAMRGNGSSDPFPL